MATFKVTGTKIDLSNNEIDFCKVLSTLALSELEEMLIEDIQREEYETCAQIRDEINSRLMK